MRVGFIVFSVAVFVAGLALGNSTALFKSYPADAIQTTAPVTSQPIPSSSRPQNSPPENNVRSGLARGVGAINLPNFSEVAETSILSVANISSRQVVRRRSPFPNDQFFRYFFGDSGNFSGYRERPSLGSGVVVRSDGFLLTNAHVVGRESAGITVTLSDNQELEAELVGRDESTDIALLRIDADNLPAIPWGDSSSLRIAEWVLAVGNPFQLNQTVTLGIVSAVGRDNLGVARYEDFIQTDAAINPGNSGGALINTNGELIGINTAIFSDSGGSQGVGFAVPSNLAKRVMEELIEHGEVRRGSFGYVDVRALTPRLARELGTPDSNGVVVWRIHQASSAAQAGLEPGDIIIAFNGITIDDSADYARLLSDAEIGTIVTLQIVRAGNRLELEIPVSQARPQ
tara:strand:- start:3878 stop:5080 length:1203 start_codon:yes stop_codon:yes gene_type:complete